MAEPGAEAGTGGPVLVLGAAGLDVVGRLDGGLKAGTSNPVRIRTSYGGVARNVAENLARLGQPVHLITVLGADHNGDEVLRRTQEAGVDLSATVRTSEFPTGFYMGVLNAASQLEFAVDDMRVMSQFTPRLLESHADLFESAALLFLDANLPEETLDLAVRLATAAHLRICADPASSALAMRLIPHLPKLFLVTPNSREAGILTGQPFDSSDSGAALNAARHLSGLGLEIALVTMAEFGVCYATSATNGHIPAISTKVLDPTGAGDAMTAAVMFALLNDIELDDAVRLGVSAASLTLRYPGTVDPDLSLQKLYDQLLI